MQNFSELPLLSMWERLAKANFVGRLRPCRLQQSRRPSRARTCWPQHRPERAKRSRSWVPVIEKLAKKDMAGVGALVLVPTRELAMQVLEQYNVLRARHHTPAALVVGGRSEGPQLNRRSGAAPG